MTRTAILGGETCLTENSVGRKHIIHVYTFRNENISTCDIGISSLYSVGNHLL